MDTNLTYAETRGNKPFDWTTALMQLITEDKLLPVYEYDVRRLASKWVTCACGNQCAIIPRTNEGIPLDSTLQTLGMIFFELIQNREWVQALRILHQIEARSASLIAQIKSQQ